MHTILGIDPGSRITGYGVIQTDGLRHRYIGSGCIRVAGELPERLGKIFQEVSVIIQDYNPFSVAIEQVFFHQNVNSALKLGRAQGVVISAAANRAIPVIEYSTRQIKQSVVGYGAAKKEQVQHMVTTLLNLSGTPQADAADALAAALCHAHCSLKIGCLK